MARLIKKKKVYWGLNLCIPEDYVMEIVRSYHFLNGHQGVDKLIKGLRNRYNFPPLPSDQNLRELATRVKRGCAVQAYENPNWATKGRYEMTTIPPPPFLSACVENFLNRGVLAKSILRLISPLCRHMWIGTVDG